MNKTYFITGIGTDVGKTIVSAIITEKIQADYYKPIQAGELDNSDSLRVKSLVSNDKTVFHKSSYELNEPMSPHSAAELDNVLISIEKINRPETKNNLVIEGAGGLFVPLNNENTILDLIKPTDKIVVVSRHYLGSINHTLLTISALKNKKLPIFGIIFNGKENKSTEEIIKKMSGCRVLGRVDVLNQISKKEIINQGKNIQL